MSSLDGGDVGEYSGSFDSEGEGSVVVDVAKDALADLNECTSDGTLRPYLLSPERQRIADEFLKQQKMTPSEVVSAVRNLASIRYQRGDAYECARLTSKANRFEGRGPRRPDASRALLELATVYANGDKYAKAAQLAERMIELDRGSKEFLCEDHTFAAQCYAKMLDDDPDAPNAMHDHAHAAYQLAVDLYGDTGTDTVFLLEEFKFLGMGDMANIPHFTVNARLRPKQTRPAWK